MVFVSSFARSSLYCKSECQIFDDVCFNQDDKFFHQSLLVASLFRSTSSIILVFVRITNLAFMEVPHLYNTTREFKASTSLRILTKYLLGEKIHAAWSLGICPISDKSDIFQDIILAGRRSILATVDQPDLTDDLNNHVCIRC